MNMILLRMQSARFSERLKRNGPCPLYIGIGTMLKLDHEAFVWEVYKQFLHREPDLAGHQSHLQLLHNGTSKLELIAAILQSREAQELYQRPSFIQALPFFTLAETLHQLFHCSPFEMVVTCYRQWLGREGDPAGMNDLLQAVSGGLPTVQVMLHFLRSEEFKALVLHSSLPTAQAASIFAKKHIGIFLFYDSPIELSGEGIGHFLLRLIDGLLAQQAGTIIHVATSEVNKERMNELFASWKMSFPHRLFVNSYPDVYAINETLPAQVWLVPFVGLHWAVYLKKPYVLCLHDLVYTHFPTLYQAKQPELIQSIEVNVRALTAKAAKVVFNSNYVRNHEGINYLKLPLHKLEVIRLAAPGNEYTAHGFLPEHHFRSKYQLAYPYLTFPSVIRLHKNHERLIQAFLRYAQTSEGALSNLHLVFTDHYADRPNEQEIKAALEHVQDAAVRNRIVFLGRLPAADLPSLYKYAQGTIVPTLFEGSCPFPVLESLTVNTPVALSRIEMALEVIEDTTPFIMFNPLSIEEMQAAIAKLAVQPRQTALLQKKALSRTLNRTWMDVAREYDRILN